MLYELCHEKLLTSRLWTKSDNIGLHGIIAHLGKPRGYKTFFMLRSAETKIYPAHSLITTQHLEIVLKVLIYEPPHGKTNYLHRRKQRHRSACFAVTAKLISAFVFATRIVQFLFYLNPKFQASSSFLCLYRLVCVGPVRKPHCWFFHEVAHIQLHTLGQIAETVKIITNQFDLM